MKRTAVILLFVAACGAPAIEGDCTTDGWDTVGSIGSEPGACVRVWSVSETMSVSSENDACGEAIPKRCVVVRDGEYAIVRAKMGSKTHIGMDGLPVVSSVYLESDGECKLPCREGLWTKASTP